MTELIALTFKATDPLNWADRDQLAERLCIVAQEYGLEGRRLITTGPISEAEWDRVCAPNEDVGRVGEPTRTWAPKGDPVSA